MNLDLSQNQKQVLSTRMQLSVKILQMNAFDLEQLICDSALDNPLIEIEPLWEADVPTVGINEFESPSSSAEGFPYFPDYCSALLSAGDGCSTNRLTETLLMQLPGFLLPEKADRQVRYLIECLDENGYLTVSHKQLMQELAIDDSRLYKLLSVLHCMDPPGVGAANLRECLLIQAKRRPDSSPVLFSLIEHHLDLLAKNQIARIAKTLRTSIDDVKEARKQLLSLNPKPGNGYFSQGSIHYIRPDLFIVRSNSLFQVVFNEYSQPKIEISNYYRSLEKNIDKHAATYIREKLNKAEWLKDCIRQRKETITKCAASILAHQLRFFEQGPGNLAPMALSDVANDLGLHPSTISRAVRGKYLQCQWGIIGLNDFFSHGVTADRCDGEPLSQDIIQTQIKQIISQEDPTSPYSDQEIMLNLQKIGINTARRTIAKYREQIGIPSSTKRKKF